MKEEQKEPPQDIITNQLNELRQLELEGYASGVKRARNALFGAAILLFLAEMIGMKASGGIDPIVLVIAIIEAGVFVVLAFLTRSRPYTAICVGLGLFIAIIILGAVLGFYEAGEEGLLASLKGGIIIKAVILFNLIRPLKEAKLLQNAIEEK